MAKLVVRLLGGFHVELDGRAIHRFESDKCRALLAYLVVEAGRPHRRETLSGLLWPDRPDAVARANLRQALSALRRALTVSAAPKDAAANFLFVTPTDVQFNTASDTTLDVADLQASRGPARGMRGRATSKSCPRHCAPTFWPVSHCPTARRFRPGCWISRSITTG